MSDETSEYLAKAVESLAGAESELAQRRFNNCANRCYYACFQAAIAALIRAGIRPPGGQGADWGHAFVKNEFAGRLVNRRKLYPVGVRDALDRTIVLRHTADHDDVQVSEIQAHRAVRRARELVQAVKAGEVRK